MRAISSRLSARRGPACAAATVPSPNTTSHPSLFMPCSIPTVHRSLSTVHRSPLYTARMNYSGLVSLVALAAAAALGQSAAAGSHGPAGPPRTNVTAAEVAQVTKSTLLIDTHNDIPSKTVDGLDIGLPGSWDNATQKGTMTDTARLRAGGVGAVFFAAYVDKKFVQGNHAA